MMWKVWLEVSMMSSLEQTFYCAWTMSKLPTFANISTGHSSFGHFLADISLCPEQTVNLPLIYNQPIPFHNKHTDNTTCPLFAPVDTTISSSTSHLVPSLLLV
jgi:hypothetical protein